MSLRAYLIAMGFATLVAGATFLLVLFRVDPGTTGAFGFVLFYASMFLTEVGILSIIGFIIRVLLKRQELLSRLVALAFRQAVLLAILTTAALFLHSMHLLAWWNSLLMLVVLTLIEFIFLSLERRTVSS